MNNNEIIEKVINNSQSKIIKKEHQNDALKYLLNRLLEHGDTIQRMAADYNLLSAVKTLYKVPTSKKGL